MNQPKRFKRKFTYGEHEAVVAAYDLEAATRTAREGRIVTRAEIAREASLKRANEIYKKHGKKTIDYDTSAGKFAPGGPAAADQALVDLRGRMIVVDKKGEEMPKWKKVEEIPQLLRLFPRCRIVYQQH
jgi:hypothetical protein